MWSQYHHTRETSVTSYRYQCVSMKLSWIGVPHHRKYMYIPLTYRREPRYFTSVDKENGLILVPWIRSTFSYIGKSYSNSITDAGLSLGYFMAVLFGLDIKSKMHFECIALYFFFHWIPLDEKLGLGLSTDENDKTLPIWTRE